MREFTIAETKKEDVLYVAANLRKTDLDAVRAFSMFSALQMAEYSFDISTHQWVGKCDGEPVCIFGVSSASAALGHGAPWLMSTAKIEQCKIPFLRGSARKVNEMKAAYLSLSNYVYTKNLLSQRWLKWLGFSLGDPVSLGYKGEKFHHFTWSKS